MQYRKLIKFVGRIPGMLVHPAIFLRKKTYILILSHMRSRSTLLSHILGSNPEITGYTEHHKSYEDWIDFIYLRRRLFQMNKEELGTPMLLDKILHNVHVLSDWAMKKSNVKIIVLLRKPEESVKSIINLGSLEGHEDYKDPGYAINYYCERLDHLWQIREKIRHNCFYIESDRILDATLTLLADLSEWLELKTPLDSKYDTFELSGKPYYGDPSKNITLGKITGKRKSFDGISLESELLTPAEEFYDKCHEYYSYI